MPKASGSAQTQATKTRRDFQRLADLRAGESAALAKAGKQQGAYYLGGFAIECALKACVAKQTRRHDFPDKRHANQVFTHDLEDLLKLARLDSPLGKDLKAKPELAKNWGVVRGWNGGSRYETSGLKGKDMVVAVNSVDGILEWIKLRW